MELETRILTEADLDAIRAIDSHDILFKYPKPADYAQSFEAKARTYLSPDFPDRILYGSFLEGRLICMMGMFVWANHPCWTLTNVRTALHPSTREAEKEAFRECIRALLGESLRRELYRFYYAVGRRNLPAQRFDRMTVMQRLVPELRQWDFYTEGLIPAGTSAKYEYQRNMVGNRIYPFDLIIRVAMFHSASRNFMSPGEN